MIDGLGWGDAEPTCTISPEGLLANFTATGGGAALVTPNEVTTVLSSGNESVLPELTTVMTFTVVSAAVEVGRAQTVKGGACPAGTGPGNWPVTVVLPSGFVAAEQNELLAEGHAPGVVVEQPRYCSVEGRLLFTIT
jgi:hypothetical protein